MAKLILENEETGPVGRLLAEKEEEKTQVLAEKFGLPYLGLAFAPIETEALALIPKKESQRANLVIFRKKGQSLHVALRNPKNKYAKKILAELKKQEFELVLFVVSLRSLEKAWKMYPKPHIIKKVITGKIEVDSESIDKFRKRIRHIENLKSAIKEVSSQDVSQILEVILASALNFDASDIHFEPEKIEFRLRYRIDGILQDIIFLSNKIHDALLSRIKLLSGLKLNIHNIAQEGRFTISVEGNEIEIRVSVLPSEYKESIALRVLNPKSLLSLRELGMRPDLESLAEKEIRRPHGMILVTGPTGSGKTTTLYAFLKHIRNPSIKIITIEEPIEYRLEGISQTQVNPGKGYDFASGLKSVLRQDPDVILVGEIRDLETAETALNAALTGHFVFSTLHTNDAAGTIPRLIDMKAKPSIIAPAINIIIAQRLVRKVCKKCARLRKISSKDLKKIQDSLKYIPKELGPKFSRPLKIVEPVGCKQCHGTGYRGRIGIFEVFVLDDEIENLILSSPSIAKMREVITKKGMVTMRQDGFLKVTQGFTTIEELERVVGAE